MFVNATKLLPGSSTADCTQGTIVVAGKCVPATPPSNTPPAPTPIGDGTYLLPNVPSINNPFAAPSCPSGYHLVRSDRCTADGVSCPSGTVLINDMMCGPEQKATTTTTPATPQTSNPSELEIKPMQVESCHQNVNQAQTESSSSPAHTSPRNEQSSCTNIK